MLEKTAIRQFALAPGETDYLRLDHAGRGVQVPVGPILTIEGDSQMPDEQRVANNSQTYVVDADGFGFETLEQENGQATVVRFALTDPRYHAGDVLLVLSGSEVHFHGMIGSVANGWAIASDRRGSLLAATLQ